MPWDALIAICISHGGGLFVLLVVVSIYAWNQHTYSNVLKAQIDLEKSRREQVEKDFERTGPRPSARTKTKAFRAPKTNKRLVLQIQRAMPGSKRTLLVADDEESLRWLIRANLERAGLGRVFEAADGGEVLQQILSKKIDVLVLDIMMPTMNGYEVLRQLRSLDYRGQIIVISGVGGPKELVASRAGVEPSYFEFLEKPFTMQQLEALIQRGKFV